MKTNKVIVLDSDDTLYSELDFLKSGYKYIANKLQPNNSVMLFDKMLKLYQSGENAFDYITGLYQDITTDELLNWYRNHHPTISLYDNVYETLISIRENYKLALITDGRSTTQRNKLVALGLDNIIECVIISEEVGSEKPSEKNFRLVEEYFQCEEYIYIGDNTKKDFITPNRLGWVTVCLLDRGFNIHKQNFVLPQDYQPRYIVKDWLSIKELLEI